jgi:hypothetical protein
MPSAQREAETVQRRSGKRVMVAVPAGLHAEAVAAGVANAGFVIERSRLRPSSLRRRYMACPTR